MYVQFSCLDSLTILSTHCTHDSGLPQSVPHRGPGHHTSRSTGRGLTHHHAAKMLGSSVDPYEHEIDSGSDDEESATGIAVNPLEAEATAALHSHVSTTSIVIFVGFSVQ